MNIYIDFSVVTTTGIAVGKVAGELDLAAPPPIGSTLVLSNPTNNAAFPQVPGFTGHLVVEHLLFSPLSAVAVNLEDLVLSTLADARLVMKFLADGFGLDAYEYESDEK